MCATAAPRGTAIDGRAERRPVREGSVAMVGAVAAAARRGEDDAGVEPQGSMRTSSDTTSPRMSSRSIFLGDSFVENTVYDSLFPALQIV